MICYRDTTFCISPDCKCSMKLTPAIEAAAERWWGMPNPPIAVACLCDEPEKKKAASDNGQDLVALAKIRVAYRSNT